VISCKLVSLVSQYCDIMNITWRVAAIAKCVVTVIIVITWFGCGAIEVAMKLLTCVPPKACSQNELLLPSSVCY
jgi:hypothetical protein